MHGTKASNFAITNSDLVIAIGARFSDRVLGDPSRFAANSKILHIDVDPAEINKNVTTDKSLVGDVKNVLSALIPHVSKAKHTPWLDMVHRWMKEVPSCYFKQPKDFVLRNRKITHVCDFNCILYCFGTVRKERAHFFFCFKIPVVVSCSTHRLMRFVVKFFKSDAA